MEGICKVKIKDGEEWVVFNERFNQKLTPDIIEFLSKYQRVKFGQCFNQSVTYQTESSQNGKSPTLLPNSLTSLIFGHCFNQPIKILPISLKEINIHYDYSHPFPKNIRIYNFS